MLKLDALKKQFKQVNSTDLKYMSYSSEAVLRQSPLAAQLLLWGMALFIFLMLIWAAFANVDQFARATGKIVPSSELQIVQNLEGGILANLMVSEGDIVKKDQPLLQIDDTIFASTYNERALQAKQLSVKAARLRAMAAGNDFDIELEKLGSSFGEDLVASERQLYHSRQQEYSSKLSALSQKVTQKEKELSAVKINKNSIEQSYHLLNEELEFTRPMLEQGAVSQVELLRLERQLNDLKGDLQKARLAIPQLEAELEEASKNLEGFKQGYTSEVRSELNEVTSELNRLQQSNQALQDRVNRTIVRSPMNGVVKQIKVKTIGGVMQPGMDLVEIVPEDDRLLVDARVLPSDIAYIYPGQKAMVKFTAYDFSIYGGLKAKVILVSPDSLLDDEGNSYYQVRLETENRYLGNEDKPLPIIPGMVVSVDIMTGKKTILDYLLKPILKTKELAFRER